MFHLANLNERANFIADTYDKDESLVEGYISEVLLREHVNVNANIEINSMKTSPLKLNNSLFNQNAFMSSEQIAFPTYLQTQGPQQHPIGSTAYPVITQAFSSSQLIQQTNNFLSDGQSQYILVVEDTLSGEVNYVSI